MVELPGIKRQHFKKIESTHSHLMRSGNELPEGTLITADFQESGRGRSMREWKASPGSSLLASLLLKPNIPPANVPQLTHVITLACVRALIGEGLDVAIRWPNDIICNDKKVAGILAEASITGDRVDYAVISFGINLNQTTDEMETIERPATSCAIEAGRTLDADEVLDSIVNELKTLYSEYVTSGFKALKKDWESLNYLRGRAITVDLGSNTVSGKMLGVDDTGALEIETEDGKRTFSSGEVVRVTGDKL